MTHRPLTKRILARLPGPRLAWMVAWAPIASLTFYLTGRINEPIRDQNHLWGMEVPGPTRCR